MIQEIPTITMRSMTAISWLSAFAFLIAMNQESPFWMGVFSGSLGTVILVATIMYWDFTSKNNKEVALATEKYKQTTQTE